jgi:hypothetical protein
MHATGRVTHNDENNYSFAPRLAYQLERTIAHPHETGIKEPDMPHG